MKTTWVIAAALLLVAAAAMDTSARGRGGKGGHTKDGWYTKRGDAKDSRHTKRGGYTSLSDQLGLTLDQQAQIEALQETLNEQRQALSDQYRTDFEALLTEEQRAIFEGIVNPLGLTEDQQAQIEALQEQGLTRFQFLVSLATILTEDQIAAFEENGFGKHGLGWRGFGKHGRGKHGLGWCGLGKHGLGFYSKDSEEETETTETADETTETAAAGKAAAVEETSWGRVKDSFGQ